MEEGLSRTPKCRTRSGVSTKGVHGKRVTRLDVAKLKVVSQKEEGRR